MDYKKASNAAVFRVHKNKNYTVMSNNHLQDRDLSLKAKGLMSVLLSLPNDWNHSIAGLTAISKESRDCIKTTLKELKEHKYLQIEKIMPNKSKSGRIEYIYHIFEEKQEVEKQALEFQRLEKQELEIHTQLNTNKESTKELNTKEKEKYKKSASTFDAEALFHLYKKICVDFPQPRELTDERKKRAAKRIKAKPHGFFWARVFLKAEKSAFCKNTNFFTFDWVIKNDVNPAKVREGNFDDKEKKLKKKKYRELELKIQQDRLEQAERKKSSIDFKKFTREQALKYLLAIPEFLRGRSTAQKDLIAKFLFTDEDLQLSQMNYARVNNG